MGMLATVMNALAMQNALEKIGVYTAVQSAIRMDTIAEPYIRRRAAAAPGEGPRGDLRRRHRQPLLHHRHGRGAARRRDGLRRALKGTSVDGVYTADPKKDPGARRYDRLTYLEVLSRDLKVMDASAISLMRENGVPIVVFSIRNRGALSEVLNGRGVHTVIAEADDAT
jgi:uridylate kinase